VLGKPSARPMAEVLLGKLAVPPQRPVLLLRKSLLALPVD
jgi:hypothetical protein